MVPSERLLASYLVRVTIQGGKRRIGLHVVGRGLHRRFDSYAELLDYLELHEDQVVREVNRSRRHSREKGRYEEEIDPSEE